jgi:rubredoxin
MSSWTCARCERTYNADAGDIEHGVGPGTPWIALPDDWACPDCGAPKFDFRQTQGPKEDGSGWTVQ